MEVLNRLSSDNIEEVTAEILGSKLTTDFQEMAQQVGSVRTSSTCPACLPACPS